MLYHRPRANMLYHFWKRKKLPVVHYLFTKSCQSKKTVRFRYFVVLQEPLIESVMKNDVKIAELEVERRTSNLESLC